MTGPIRPDEMGQVRPSEIPEAVFDVFNALIETHWDGERAVFLQDHVLHRLMEKLRVTRAHVFAEKWLHVEGAYEDAGWSVHYVVPGREETAKFIFTRKT